MPNEVWAKLGVDTASVPADMNKAKTAFTQGAKDIEDTAGKTGDGAGSKLVGGIEHRLLGARHLSGVLATALGLNIEHIAEHIAAALVGGSKEAWEEMGKIADENSKLIEKRIELSLNPKQLQERIKKQATVAAGELQSTIAQNGPEDEKRRQLIAAGMLSQTEADRLSNAEKQVAIGKAEHASLEADVALEEQRKQVKEAEKKLDEFREESASKGLSDSEKDKKLNEEVNKLLGDIVNKNGSELEIIAMKHRLVEIDNQQRAEVLAKKDREIEKERELLRLRISLGEAQRKLAQDEESLANKKADQGKLTIGEIANLKPGETGPQFGQDTHVDTYGLSEEAAKAKETAAEIQRMQKQAEQLRSSGDVGGANALFDQIGAKKQTLVDSGFAKSTEGDQFKQLEETIHKDSLDVQKIIGEIAEVAKGKLKNE